MLVRMNVFIKRNRQISRLLRIRQLIEVFRSFCTKQIRLCLQNLSVFDKRTINQKAACRFAQCIRIRLHFPPYPVNGSVCHIPAEQLVSRVSAEGYRHVLPRHLADKVGRNL